jgi:hypothetical protein
MLSVDKPLQKATKQQTWRLKKTLSRNLGYRPIEQEDVKYVWAAYVKGALGSMRDDWKQPGLSAAEFTEAFKAEVIQNYSSAWILFAETPKGFMPVGMVLAFFSHPNPRLAPFQIIGDFVWFPWASPRNRIESAANFLAKVRKEHRLVEYAQGEKTKRFFELMCRLGVMRRVGTTFVVFPGEPVAVFETRRS